MAVLTEVKPVIVKVGGHEKELRSAVFDFAIVAFRV